MKKVIAKKDFILGSTSYIAGDEVETNNIDLIIKLNEKGFIEPLEYKDIVLIERELKKKKEEL